MLSLINRYVKSACDSGRFGNRRTVLTFAISVAVYVTLAADALNVAAHYSLHFAGLLPYDVVPATIVGVSISTVVASMLTFSIVYIVGLAIHHLTVSRAEFERLSQTDALSGLLNRRALMTHATSFRSGSLVLFDIDRFKSINDHYGHEVGDMAIVTVAERLTSVFGHDAVIARIGGEEFAVLTNSYSLTSLETAWRCVEEISSHAVEAGDHRIALTVSGGVADTTKYETFETLYRASDRALYVAKTAGRNRVVHIDDAVSLAQPITLAEKDITGPHNSFLKTVPPDKGSKVTKTKTLQAS